MSADQNAATASDSPTPSTQWLDLIAIGLCALIWGTTWFAITLQFGVVDPVISVVYRFALAAALLFAWCALRKERIAISAAQHFAALGVGVSTFTINYTLVYWAEERVASAVVAVVFAAMAFLNLIGFRLVYGQRASALMWAAASLGVAGVAALSWEEIAASNFDQRALSGVGLTLIGVIASVIGNLFARRGETAGATVAASTGWAMGYGSAALAIFALLSGRVWAFEFTPAYIFSLLHLAVNGSVIAFLLYYGLARRRGYAMASYTSALTPPIAMLVSSLFEAKTWGLFALFGVLLVMSGQALMLRAKRA